MDTQMPQQNTTLRDWLCSCSTNRTHSLEFRALHQEIVKGLIHIKHLPEGKGNFSKKGFSIAKNPLLNEMHSQNGQSCAYAHTIP